MFVVPQKYALRATITREMWEDAQARDWALHGMVKRLHVGLCNAGLRPFGPVRYRYHVPRPEEFIYDPSVLYVLMWQRGVSVVPVHPTEWDTTCC